MSGREELVERIVREVLHRLQAGGASGGDAPAVPVPAGGAPALRAYNRSYDPYPGPPPAGDPALPPGAPGAEPSRDRPAFIHPSAADGEDRARATNPAGRSPETVRTFVAAGASRISGSAGSPAVPRDIAHYIDHTMLKPDATDDQIRVLCREARDNHFASVCVNPSFVKLCADELRGSDVLVCTVVGFPLGATTAAAKAFEARKAIREGAREVDMVINVGALKSGDYALVAEDIEAVVEACHESGVLVKVIIEAALLTDEEKVAACLLAKRARAEYVKTSTGFASGGATIRDVAIMRATVGPEMGVKAAGGIRTYLDAIGMIEAGATRIGASAGVRIVKEAKGEAVDAPSGKGPY